MKKLLFPSLALVMSLTLTACNNTDTNGISQQEQSSDSSKQESPGNGTELVKFPEGYDNGVLFTTVTRGNTYEELYTSPEAIEAVQNGQPIPSGTVITLKIFRDEELYRYFVMEKRDRWGDQNPPDMRNGDWQYQSFSPDGSVDEDADIGRCFSCHANAERDDYVNKLDEMKSYDLEDVTGSKESSTESQIAGIPTNHWEVKEVDNNPEDPRDILHGNGLMEDEEKAGIIQKVFLMIHFNKET
ncbi:cytochrome P460 family protein [Bacillus sp. ISL-40]|uniref:cytochrome P460 family protein n=1 Tax=unclassified Bacillus (in: firmicutes) TaxID=185979 RepID=UPI001BE730B3|nr:MULTISPECIES: cytochrome P460 family protein [unclassified Bacillus (in: firmicutes)]MBT2696433.1 cytochrome P460 family protein [Bacillus sp. ISL-40]MBT2723203.1 cytochrome P460 family protein [Bacillus sp. ISL-46]MBT2741551.1 cytochrome P460 family protein [Bacillus sp. ISL-77]